MKTFAWDETKNDFLKRDRCGSYEEVDYHINNGDLLAKLDHPNRTKYPHQQVFILVIDEYIYMVPFVEDEERYFLKTVIPSRRLTRDYLKGRKDGHETE